jgi:ribosomal protein S18 acetylase RimI-like enzyme
MINLEKEFGSFLDLLEEHLNSEELLHYGVKGMRWGVRKERRPAPELKGLGPDSITRKTASGEEITISRNMPNALHRFLGRHSQKYREDYAKGAFLTIKNKDGKSVGDAIVEKKSKDELYLLWLGIKKSERGKGYATAVMKAAEEFGRKEGFKKLTLEVPGNAKDAEHIYSKLGFKVTKQVVEGGVWGGLTEMEYVFSNKKVKHTELDANHEVVIVAIPQVDDYVWKVSSEKVPHMTLLYLGEAEVTQHMIDFVEHASSLLPRFGMSVERRGILGDQDADVLFFDKSYSYKKLMDFRAQLLTDDDIYSAFHSVTQYPEWLPHLTLGFPDTPAKPMNREYGFNWVEFDRIAIWVGDSEGPTYQLKSDHGLEVAMSDVPQGSDLDTILEHYGVKGMKWGVRKKRSRQTEPDSEDSSRVSGVKSRVSTQKTTKILSTAELKDAIERMRLEQEFSKLSGGIDKTRSQKTAAFISKMLIDTGKQNVSQTFQSESKRLVDEQLKKTRV